MKNERPEFITTPSNRAITVLMKSVIGGISPRELTITGTYFFSSSEAEQFMHEVRSGEIKYNPPADVKRWMDRNPTGDSPTRPRTRPRFWREDVKEDPKPKKVRENLNTKFIGAWVFEQINPELYKYKDTIRLNVDQISYVEDLGEIDDTVRRGSPELYCSAISKAHMQNGDVLYLWTDQIYSRVYSGYDDESAYEEY